MMVSMRLQKIMAVTVALALLTAMAAGLSVLNTRNSVASPTWTMISRFIVILVFGTFGLAVARESQLPGSLLINVEEWSLTIRDIINCGVLPGLVLGLIKHLSRELAACREPFAPLGICSRLLFSEPSLSTAAVPSTD